MHHATRLLLVLLLLIAVPFKVAVAASMVMCGPGHEPGVTAAVTETDSVMSGTNPHTHDHDGHHHPGHAVDAHDDGATGVDHEAPALHGATQCSICAACCVGGAILTSAETNMLARSGNEVSFPPLDIQFRSFVLAGLERPPRSTLV